MKHLLLSLLICLPGLATGTDFEKIDIPTSANINKILFVGPAYGWAVTSDGELLSTYNGGRTWKVKKITTRRITDITVRDRRGYLCGERGLLMKSNDRGSTWQDISQPMKFNFTGISIVNDSSAIVCGTDRNSMAKTRGVLFQTWDYSKTWKKHNHLGNGYVDVVTNPPHRIYLLAIKSAFHSINAGLNFISGKYEGKHLAFAFDFDDAWGYLVGRKGFFARSTNHGRDWTDIELEMNKNLYAISMFDHNSGIAIGEDGVILYFENDGQKNRLVHCGHDVDLLSVFVTDTHIFCGGKNGTLLSKERK
ncbi:MAG: hypothetical protein GY841_01870 [FCB group bacterium]|nr:hypothetical protein [FCB group bacterium]